MTDNDLSKLSRKELLEMLLQLSVENQELREKLRQAEADLRDRQIRIDAAGSIAEASLQLNGVFEAAQAACQQYMENIENLSHRQEEICRRMEEDSRAKANAILEAARQQQAATLHATELRCAELTRSARAQSEIYWDQVSRRLDKFYAERPGLQEQLRSFAQRKREQDKGL